MTDRSKRFNVTYKYIRRIICTRMDVRACKYNCRSPCRIHTTMTVSRFSFEPFTAIAFRTRGGLSTLTSGDSEIKRSGRHGRYITLRYYITATGKWVVNYGGFNRLGTITFGYGSKDFVYPSAYVYSFTSLLPNGNGGGEPDARIARQNRFRVTDKRATRVSTRTKKTDDRAKKYERRAITTA